MRQDLADSELVIGVITLDSLRSGYVLHELGAAWGLKKWIVPLLGPGVDFSDVPDPLKERIAISIL
jgi:hypothetical protein